MYRRLFNTKLIECLQIADKRQINVNAKYLKKGWLVWYDRGRGNQPIYFLPLALGVASAWGFFYESNT